MPKKHTAPVYDQAKKDKHVKRFHDAMKGKTTVEARLRAAVDSLKTGIAEEQANVNASMPAQDIIDYSKAVVDHSLAGVDEMIHLVINGEK
jgi:glutaredoxin 2